MKIFISWSANRSRYVATYLKTWLETVFSGQIDTFMSDKDIGAGMDWSTEIAKNIDACDFGIICLTPENRDKPWVMFEAGGIAKRFNVGQAVPFLIGMKAKDLAGNPLSKFQAKEALREEHVLQLVEEIHKASGASQMKIEPVKAIFKKFWPDLQNKLKKLPKAEEEVPKAPSHEEILSDLLIGIQDIKSTLAWMKAEKRATETSDDSVEVEDDAETVDESDEEDVT